MWMTVAMEMLQKLIMPYVCHLLIMIGAKATVTIRIFYHTARDKCGVISVSDLLLMTDVAQDTVITTVILELMIRSNLMVQVVTSFINDGRGTSKPSLVTPPSYVESQEMEETLKLYDVHTNDNIVVDPLLLDDETTQKPFKDYTRFNVDNRRNYGLDTSLLVKEKIRRVSIQSHRESIPNNETLTLATKINDHTGCEHFNRFNLDYKISRNSIEDVFIDRASDHGLVDFFKCKTGSINDNGTSKVMEDMIVT
jgi:hypothetical protein